MAMTWDLLFRKYDMEVCFCNFFVFSAFSCVFASLGSSIFLVIPVFLVLWISLSGSFLFASRFHGSSVFGWSCFRRFSVFRNSSSSCLWPCIFPMLLIIGFTASCVACLFSLLISFLGCCVFGCLFLDPCEYVCFYKLSWLGHLSFEFVFGSVFCWFFVF